MYFKKSDVHATCLMWVDSKITYIQQLIDELKVGAENDSKSSAGDKHETSRAMMQLEQEKLMKQLQLMLQHKDFLMRLNVDDRNQFVKMGSVVCTDHEIFYISVALGNIAFQQRHIIVLSPTAPIAQCMKGLKTGDAFIYNHLNYTIRSIA
jgi:hypothetical protein